MHCQVSHRHKRAVFNKTSFYVKFVELAALSMYVCAYNHYHPQTREQHVVKCDG